MLARTVCETALARAKFVRNSKIFPFFCDSRANFAHQQAKKSFFKKINFEYFCRFYGRRRSKLLSLEIRPPILQHKPQQKRLYLRNISNST